MLLVALHLKDQSDRSMCNMLGGDWGAGGEDRNGREDRELGERVASMFQLRQLLIAFS